MIPFRINAKLVKCPNDWSEVTVAQAIALRKTSNLSEIFRILSGCDLDIPEDQLEQAIFPFLTFMTEPINFDKLSVPNNIEVVKNFSYIKPIKNLGHCSFKQKIEAQRIVHNAFKGNPETVDVTAFMVELLAVYTPDLTREEIEKLKFIECYPVFNHYCDEIVRLVKRDKQYLDRKPDPDLNLAGIEKLSKFGELSVIDTLCGGDIKKYDDILGMEYDVIFKKLWFEREKQDLYDRVRTIKERKLKQKK